MANKSEQSITQDKINTINDFNDRYIHYCLEYVQESDPDQLITISCPSLQHSIVTKLDFIYKESIPTTEKRIEVLNKMNKMIMDNQIEFGNNKTVKYSDVCDINNDNITQKYLNYYYEYSNDGNYKYIKETTVSDINILIFNKFEVHVPPISKQKKIVEELVKNEKIIKELEETIEQNKEIGKEILDMANKKNPKIEITDDNIQIINYYHNNKTNPKKELTVELIQQYDRANECKKEAKKLIKELEPTLKKIGALQDEEKKCNTLYKKSVRKLRSDLDIIDEHIFKDTKSIRLDDDKSFTKEINKTLNTKKTKTCNNSQIKNYNCNYKNYTKLVDSDRMKDFNTWTEIIGMMNPYYQNM
jgi:hypothetical protein